MNEFEYFMKLVEKYNEKFEEWFPLMETRGQDKKELIKEIEKCLKENKEYEFEIEEDVDY